MKKMKHIFAIVCALFISHTAEGLKIDRVILATNTNKTYIDFWPLVAQAWKEIVGVTPTLALIAPADTIIDETCGDVLRFEPIPGIPTSLHAQVIRLLLPTYFDDDVCIISDIDMLPLNKNYFVDSIAHVPDNHFIVYRNKAYAPALQRYPMCYNAAKGSTFKEIFHITNPDIDIPIIIKNWHRLNLGWNTDEIMLTQSLAQWNGYPTRCTKLDHKVERRVDRSNWRYNPALVKAGFYIDAHCLRPYEKYKKEINVLAQCMGLDIKENNEDTK